MDNQWILVLCGDRIVIEINCIEVLIFYFQGGEETDMGHYLNPGNEGFKRALRARIYVDKTEMIEYVNSVLGTDDGFICVSRPRRFGKSMAANMLAAYYDRSCESETLFEDLKISAKSSYKEHLNQHDVIFLNIQQILSGAGSPDKVPDFARNVVLKELQEAYPEYVSEQDCRQCHRAD